MQDIESSKDAGSDNLLGSILRDGAGILAKPVFALSNLSISHGVFPNACKIEKLKPIFKNGEKTGPSNYRPICLLSVISKNIGKVVHDQTMLFIQMKIYYATTNQVLE